MRQWGLRVAILLTLAITFNWLVIWLSYFSCVFRVTRHFFEHQKYFATVQGISVSETHLGSLNLFQKEDVRLVGTLIPRYCRFLPRPPHSKNPEYYFPYQCFRLVCERLFGKAVCYSAYSVDIPAREYEDQHLELVVTKVNNKRQSATHSDTLNSEDLEK